MVVLLMLLSLISEARMSFGVMENQERTSLIISDFNQFNPNDGGRWKAFRYGFGYGMTELNFENASLGGVASNYIPISLSQIESWVMTYGR